MEIINKDIRKKANKVIILMKAAPQVFKNTAKNKYEAIGYKTKFVSNLQNSLTRICKESKKQITLKFDILTQKNLYDTLE